MKADSDGFLYPEVEAQKCVDCGLCVKVCPILNKPQIPSEHQGAYVFQNANSDVLRTSTSGGFIDFIYQQVVLGGGTQLV